MHSLLPQGAGVRVAARSGRLDSKAIATVDQLVVVVPERITEKLWKQLPGGLKLQKLASKRAAGSVPQLVTRLDNARQTLLVIARARADAQAFDRLSLAQQLVSVATEEKAGTLGLAAIGFSDEQSGGIVAALLAAALAAAAPAPEWKTKTSPPKIRRVRLFGKGQKSNIARVTAEAAGNNLARWLTALPPNLLDAKTYADIAKDLAGEHGWHFKRYSVSDLEKLGAGAFLAVAQGNADDDAGIVCLKYRPGRKNDKPAVSLVGKGIIFDTGGTNLKPFQSMLDMHGDMQGSAVALGSLLALTELKVPFSVDCWLALTENRTGPTAYKSQDLITALNGKTIQTIHTDAEGRMALADTLTLASREKPRLVIDYATLTGSCIDAITTRYSGVFTNHPELHPELTRAGLTSGERVWPFPIGGEFLEDLKSPVADLMQCTIKGTGDHIYAASFLGQFVEDDTPWVHVDLSAGEHDGGLAHIPTKVTGFGVRLTLSLLLDEELAGNS